jgi:hypothetical protein
VALIAVPALGGWLNARAEPAAAADLGCGDNYTVSTSVGRLSNNVWNKQAAGTFAYRQCIRARGPESARQYGWSWHAPDEGNTFIAFPETVFGWKPWDGGVSNHAKLPVRIDAIGAATWKYEVETKATGKHSLATSMWITRTGKAAAEPNPLDITTDFSIWTDGFGFPPFGTQVDQTTIDGVEFEIWSAPNQGDPKGPHWNYLAYRSKVKQLAASLDIRTFLDDAIARGLVSSSDHLSSIELGNEVLSGSGETWIKHVSLEVR